MTQVHLQVDGEVGPHFDKNFRHPDILSGIKARQFERDSGMSEEKEQLVSVART